MDQLVAGEGFLCCRRLLLLGRGRGTSQGHRCRLLLLLLGSIVISIWKQLAGSIEVIVKMMWVIILPDDLLLLYLLLLLLLLQLLLLLLLGLD